MDLKTTSCTDDDTLFIWEKLRPCDIPSQGEGAEEQLLVFKATDEGGDIIGGCVLDIDLSKAAEFNSLWVDERFRRKGVGSALILESERAAYFSGCRIIVNAYNFDFQAARPLFEKHGYKLIGTAADWPKGHESYTLIKRPAPVPEEIALEEPSGLRFCVLPGSEEDGKLITDKLNEYNNSFAPRAHPYIDLDKKLEDGEGRMIAGCIAGVSGWNTAHIDAIWVDEAIRGRGVGSFLLLETEREARKNGAYLARTDAEASQAEFFIKRGYEVTVVYEDAPRWCVLQKRL